MKQHILSVAIAALLVSPVMVRAEDAPAPKPATSGTIIINGQPADPKAPQAGKSLSITGSAKLVDQGAAGQGGQPVVKSGSVSVNATGGKATVTITSNGKVETHEMDLSGLQEIQLDQLGKLAGGLVGAAGQGQPVTFFGVVSEAVPQSMIESMPPDAAEGLFLRNVVPNSPAARAGLKGNDVIVTVDGKAVGKSEEFQKFIRTKKSGDVVKVSYLRQGQRNDVEVTLAESEAVQAAPLIQAIQGKLGGITIDGNAVQAGVAMAAPLVQALSDKLAQGGNQGTITLPADPKALMGKVIIMDKDGKVMLSRDKADDTAAEVKELKAEVERLKAQLEKHEADLKEAGKK